MSIRSSIKDLGSKIVDELFGDEKYKITASGTSVGAGSAAQMSDIPAVDTPNIHLHDDTKTPEQSVDELKKNIDTGFGMGMPQNKYAFNMPGQGNNVPIITKEAAQGAATFEAEQKAEKDKVIKEAMRAGRISKYEAAQLGYGSEGKDLVEEADIESLARAQEGGRIGEQGTMAYNFAGDIYGGFGTLWRGIKNIVGADDVEDRVEKKYSELSRENRAIKEREAAGKAYEDVLGISDPATDQGSKEYRLKRQELVKAQQDPNNADAIAIISALNSTDPQEVYVGRQALANASSAVRTKIQMLGDLQQQFEVEQAKEQSREFLRNITRNKDLDGDQLDKWTKQVVMPIFINDDGTSKIKNSYDYGAYSVLQSLSNNILAKYSEIADRAVDLGKYTSKDDFFEKNGVYKKVHDAVQAYGNNFQGDETAQKMLNVDGTTGTYDLKGLQEYTKDKDNYSLITDGLQKDWASLEQKNYEDAVFDRGGSVERDEGIASLGGDILRLYFHNMTSGETIRKLGGEHIVADDKGTNIFGRNTYGSIRKNVYGQKTFWDEAGDVVLNDPLQSAFVARGVVSMMSGLGTASRSLTALTELASTAPSRSMFISQASQMLGRTSVAILGENLNGLAVSLMINKTPADWALDLGFNSLGGIRLGKLKDIGYLSKWLEKTEDVAVRSEQLKKYLGVSELPNTLSLVGGKADIETQLKGYVSNLKGLAMSNEANVAYQTAKGLQTDVIPNMGYDDLKSTHAGFAVLKGNKGVKSLVGADVDALRTIIKDGEKEIAELEKVADAVAVAARKEEIVQKARTIANTIVDNLDPNTLKKFGYSIKAQKLSTSAVSKMVNDLHEMSKTVDNPEGLPIPMIYGAVTNSLLGTRKGVSSADNLAGILAKKAAKLGDKEMYAKMVKIGTDEAGSIETTQKIVNAAASNPEGFVKAVDNALAEGAKAEGVAETATVKTGKTAKGTKTAENVTLGKKVTKGVTGKTAKTTTEKTKRTIASVKTIESSNIKTATDNLYNIISRKTDEIMASDGRKNVADGNINQKKDYIASYINNQDLGLSKKQANSVASMIASQINGGNITEHKKMMASLLGDIDKTKSVDSVVKEMDKMSNLLGGAKADAVGIIEEDMADMFNVISSGLKKYAKNTGSEVTSFIYDGIANFAKFAKENAVLFRKSNLPAGIDGITSVITNDGGRKMIISLSGHIISRIQDFSKGIPDAEKIHKYKEAMSTLFHEMGHVSFESIDETIAKKVKDGINNMIKEGGFLDSDKLKALLGDELYKSRIDLYRSLDEKDLAHEIFADKFQRDLYDAVFNASEYQERVLKTFGGAGIVPAGTSKNVSSIQNIIGNIVEGLSEYLKELITMVSWTINPNSIDTALSSINFAIIKGENDALLGRNVKSAIEKQKDYFKRVLGDMEKNILNYQGATAEERRYLFEGRDSMASLAQYISAGKGKAPTINPTMLSQRGRQFMADIMDYASMTEKQQKLYNDVIAKATDAMHAGIRETVAATMNLLYDGKRVLKTKNEGLSLMDLLHTLPNRVSMTKATNSASGGIYYAKGMGLMKYALTSGYDDTRKILVGFFNSYYEGDRVNSVFGSSDRFKIILGLGEEQGIGDGIMKVYDEMRAKLLKMDNVDPAYADDILNPFLYYAQEYVNAIGSIDVALMKNVKPSDIVLAKILKRRRDALGLDIGNLADLARVAAKDLPMDHLPQGEAIRNILSAQLEKHLTEFMNKGDYVLPMNPDQMSAYLYKNAGFFEAGGDTQLLNISAQLSSKIPLIENNKVKALLLDLMNRFGGAFMKGGKEELSNFVDVFKQVLEKNNIHDAETDALLNVLESYSKGGDEANGVVGDYFMKKLFESEEYAASEWQILGGEKTIDEIVEDVNKKKEFEEIFLERQTSLDTAAGVIKDTAMKHAGSENTTATASNVMGVLGINERDAEVVSAITGLSKEELATGVVEENKVINHLLTQAYEGKTDFAEMVLSNDRMMNVFNDMFESSAKGWGKNGKSWYKIGENGKIRLQENPSTAIWNRFLHTFNTITNIGFNDEETGRILGDINNAKSNMFIHNWNAKFSKQVEGSPKYLSADVYKNMARAEIEELQKKMKYTWRSGEYKKQRVNAIYNHALEKGYAEGDIIQGVDNLTAEEKKYAQFISDYISDIDTMRGKLGLGRIRWDDDKARFLQKNKVIKAGEEGEGHIRTGLKAYLDQPGSTLKASGHDLPDVVLNKLTGLWTYAKEEDTLRLYEKYANRGMQANSWFALNGFLDDMLYAAGRNTTSNIWGKRSSGTGGYVLRAIGKLEQRLGSFFLFSLGTQPYKIFQQVLSNAIGAQAQMALGGNVGKEYDELFKMIDNDLGFSVLRTANKNDEGGFFANAVSKTKQLLGQSTSIMMNALPLGDEVTRKRVTIGAMVKANIDDYAMLGEKGIQKFHKDVTSLKDWQTKRNINDADFFTVDNVNKKIARGVRTANPMATEGELTQLINNEYITSKAYTEFYKNKYTPFVNRTRLNLSTFFVTDNIQEFAGINGVNNNRFAFGLMKWATGKSAEIAMNLTNDARKAFQGNNMAAGLKEFLSSKSVRELYYQMYYGAKVGRQLDKGTDGSFGTLYTMSVLSPFLAAGVMAIGDAIYEGMYKDGIQGKEERGQNWLQAIWEGLASTLGKLGGRAGIYNAVVFSKLSKGVSTAYNMTPADDRDALTLSTNFGKALLKNVVFDAWNKYAATNVQGIYKYDNTDGTTLDNMLEYILNAKTEQRKDQERLLEREYEKIGENANEKLWNMGEMTSSILKYIPGLGNLYMTSIDYSFILKNHQDYLKNSGTNILYNRSAAPKDIVKALQKMEQINIQTSDKYNNLGGDITNVQGLIEKGIITDDITVVNDIISGLRLDGKTGKGTIRNALGTLPTEEEQRKLFDDAMKIIEEKDKDKSGSFGNYENIKSDATPSQKFQTFVAYIEKMGYKADLGYLLNAYQTGLRKDLKKVYGLKGADITEGEKGVKDTKSAKYQEYVIAYRAEMMDIVSNMRGVIGTERHVIYDLQNKMATNDKEYISGGIRGKLAKESSTPAILIQQKQIDAWSQQDGLGGNIFSLNSVMMAKEGYSVKNIDTKTEEGKKKFADASKTLAKHVQTNLDMVIQHAKTSAEIVGGKIGAAAAIAPVIREIQAADPETANKMINDIGKESFLGLADIMSDSSPATFMDALEMITGDVLHGGGAGGRGRKGKTFTPKMPTPEQQKAIDNYNKLATFSANNPVEGSPSLPKFTYHYDRETGSYIPVKINVNPKLTDITTTQIRPESQPAPKLAVGTAPVKQGRVVSGTAKARAIGNAKVYTRKAGSKWS